MIDLTEINKDLCSEVKSFYSPTTDHRRSQAAQVVQRSRSPNTIKKINRQFLNVPSTIRWTPASNQHIYVDINLEPHIGCIELAGMANGNARAFAAVVLYWRPSILLYLLGFLSDGK
jgi:hypothetical protein